jgi:hypothetical protein
VTEKDSGDEQPDETGTRPTGLFSKILGRFTMFKVTNEVLYAVIVLFAIGSFTLALTLRKRRISESRSIYGIGKKPGLKDEVRSNLFDLKSKSGMFGGSPATTEHGKEDKPSMDPSNLTWNQLKDKWLNGNGPGHGD